MKWKTNTLRRVVWSSRGEHEEYLAEIQVIGTVTDVERQQLLCWEVSVGGFTASGRAVGATVALALKVAKRRCATAVSWLGKLAAEDEAPAPTKRSRK